MSVDLVRVNRFDLREAGKSAMLKVTQAHSVATGKRSCLWVK
jgi:hypothetical protein